MWLKLSADCLFERADSISTQLEESGALSVSIAVSDTDRTLIEALFDANFEQIPEIQETLAFSNRDDSDFRISSVALEDRDWVGESQRNLNPIEVGNDLRIAAPWHEVSDDRQTVIINPGLSFGTGHHETTRMCAGFLSELNLAGTCVIDYGCGSGILAICALALGAEAAWGVDIDPDALVDSRENAIRNGVENAYYPVAPDELPDELQADVVVANLFADALVDLSKELVRLTRPGGWLILSGMLDTQIERVRMAYSDCFDLSIEQDGQWVMLCCRRAK